MELNLEVARLHEDEAMPGNHSPSACRTSQIISDLCDPSGVFETPSMMLLLPGPRCYDS